MTPNTKAKELVIKFFDINDDKLSTKGCSPFIDRDYAKKCATIAVDEIIQDNSNIYDSDRLNFKYWNKVKQEIEKL
jgi:hypothetical protein